MRQDWHGQGTKLFLSSESSDRYFDRQALQIFEPPIIPLAKISEKVCSQVNCSTLTFIKAKCKIILVNRMSPRRGHPEDLGKRVGEGYRPVVPRLFAGLPSLPRGGHVLILSTKNMPHPLGDFLGAAKSSARKFLRF